MASYDTALKINKIDQQIQSIEDHVRTLKSAKVSANVTTKKDSSKMAGDKYDAYHDKSKSLTKSCKTSVHSERDAVITALGSAKVTLKNSRVNLRMQYVNELNSEEASRRAKAETDRKEREKASK